MWKRLRWVLLAVVILVIAVPAIWFLKLAKTIAGKDGSVRDVLVGITEPRKLFPEKQNIVVLVLGKDYDRDRKGMPYSKNSRADTIMLINVDLANPGLKAVSIPRDTKMTASDGVTGKFNSAMSRGGPQLIMDTLAQHFGVTVDYYVVLKPSAVRSIVDELGGVTVETLDEMVYNDDWGQLHINLPKGRVTLNGEQAEGYVRFRKSDPSARRKHKGPNLEEGDIRRAARQQQLIHAMVQAGMRPGNWTRASDIIQTGFNQLDTNLSQTQLLALASLFRQAGVKGIQSGTLPGEDSTESGVYYWVIDEVRSYRMLAWLIRNDEGAGRGLPRVAVYNASKVSGAARTAASMLYSEGFEAMTAGTKKAAPVSMITFRSALYQTQAQQIANRLGIQQIEKEQGNPLDSWSPDVKVTLGADLAPNFAPIPGAVAQTTAARRAPRIAAPDISVEAERSPG